MAVNYPVSEAHHWHWPCTHHVVGTQPAEARKGEVTWLHCKATIVFLGGVDPKIIISVPNLRLRCKCITHTHNIYIYRHYICIRCTHPLTVVDISPNPFSRSCLCKSTQSAEPLTRLIRRSRFLQSHPVKPCSTLGWCWRTRGIHDIHVELALYPAGIRMSYRLGKGENDELRPWNPKVDLRPWNCCFATIGMRHHPYSSYPVWWSLMGRVVVRM